MKPNHREIHKLHDRLKKMELLDEFEQELIERYGEFETVEADGDAGGLIPVFIKLNCRVVVDPRCYGESTWRYFVWMPKWYRKKRAAERKEAEKLKAKLKRSHLKFIL